MNIPDTTTHAAQPTTLWGHVVQITPIVMTVLATALAGISSSEMTQSMYYRSLAGQHQAKAGDQWSFYQSKRLRETSLAGTVTLLRSLTHVDRPTPDRLADALRSLSQHWALIAESKNSNGDYSKSPPAQLAQWLTSAQKNGTLQFLAGQSLPFETSKPLPDGVEFDDLRTALALMPKQRTEAELAHLVRAVTPERVEEVTATVEHNSVEFSAACEPTNSAIGQLRGFLTSLPRSADAGTTAGADKLSSEIEVAALDYDARRCRRESQYNRTVAQLYELQVARSGVESDIHRERSRKFFYSMLFAQAGVTIASLALARANHSLFWILAAIAGLTALGISATTFFLLR